MPHSLLIRADASSTIGVGHAMRCLALAQAWQDTNGQVAWLARELPDSLARRLRREGIDLHLVTGEVGDQADADLVARLAALSQADWVAVDGYRFSPGYLKCLRDSGRQVLAIDDMVHLERYPVDALLNQNEGVSPARYGGKTDGSAALMLGAGFSLLRREFRTASGARAPREGRMLRVLVTFGGSDPANYSQRILERLEAGARQDLHVMVVAGAANRHVLSLRAATARASFRCELRVDVENVAPLMAWADVAIAAAGSTVWELAAMRLPAVIGAGEENQLAVLRGLPAIPFFRAGTAAELLRWDLAAEIDALMARPAGTGWPAIDACGATRVAAALRERIPTVAIAS